MSVRSVVRIAVALAVLWCVAGLTPRAEAATYGFTNITNNGAIDAAANLSVDVNAAAPNAAFKFYWTSAALGSITDIYFDDNAGVLLAFSTFTEPAGVDFGAGAAPPNLPGGNTVIPAFAATFDFDSENPAPANGVDTLAEYLTIAFSLSAGKTFGDVIAALNDGTLRLGLHVQSIGTASFSDAFVNLTPVPLPAALPLFGSALAAMGIFRWWRRRRSDPLSA